MGSNIQKYAHGKNNPADDAIAVTPNDSSDLSHETRGLWVGTSGNLKVNMAGAQSTNPVTFPDAYGWLPICVTRIYSTDTTASGIVAVW